MDIRFALVEGRTDGLPADAPVVAHGDSYAASKEELRDLSHQTLMKQFSGAGLINCVVCSCAACLLNCQIDHQFYPCWLL